MRLQSGLITAKATALPSATPTESATKSRNSPLRHVVSVACITSISAPIKRGIATVHTSSVGNRRGLAERRYSAKKTVFIPILQKTENQKEG